MVITKTGFSNKCFIKRWRFEKETEKKLLKIIPDFYSSTLLEPRYIIGTKEDDHDASVSIYETKA